MIRRIVAVAAVMALLSGPAFAQVTLDGSITGDGYGPAASVQTVQTQFGDNSSELNAAYAFTSGGNLHLAITGNLETNFNKLNIFIDSVSGSGENVISAAFDNGGNNPNNDNWANEHAGLTFDSGFAPDYLLINRSGFAGGERFDFDFSSVGNNSVVESSVDVFGGTFTGANASVGAAGIGIAFDNSNAAGIGGGTGAADGVAAQAVSTGFEFIIPLSAIGNPQLGDEILIAAHINGSNHDFLSNQILGGLAAPQGNLGGDGGGGFIDNLSGINFNNFAGDQFFTVTVVPEPTSAGLCLIGAAAMGLVRRRRQG